MSELLKIVKEGTFKDIKKVFSDGFFSKSKYDINQVLENGNTAFFICLIENKNISNLPKEELKKIIEFFIEKGIDVNLQNDNKETAAIYFSKNKKSLLSIHLLNIAKAYSVKLNIKDINGDALIHHFLKNKMLNDIALEILLHYGADINIRDNNGRTVLMGISKYFIDAKLCKVFIDNNADFAATDNDGNNLLHLYKETKLSFIKIFVSQDMDINDKNNNNNSALAKSVIELDILKINSLIRNGADLETRNFQDKTPLESLFVKKRRSEEEKDIYKIVQALISNGADTTYQTKEKMYLRLAKKVMKLKKEQESKGRRDTFEEKEIKKKVKTKINEESVGKEQIKKYTNTNSGYTVSSSSYSAGGTGNEESYPGRIEDDYIKQEEERKIKRDRDEERARLEKEEKIREEERVREEERIREERRKQDEELKKQDEERRYQDKLIADEKERRYQQELLDDEKARQDEQIRQDRERQDRERQDRERQDRERQDEERRRQF